jgi:hypothetical protein
LEDFASSSSYEYYVFHTNDSASPVTFTVTPFSGDPDLYVSTSTAMPRAGNSMWRSTGFGEEHVTIVPSDPGACKNATCNYYVGVNGFGNTNASYSILAEVGNNDSISLVDGQPVASTVEHGNTKQYVLHVVPGTPTISVMGTVVL